MKIKNKLTFLATLLAATLPLTAAASALITENNTNADSSVKVTSSKSKLCSYSFGKYTAAHSKSETSGLVVRGICEHLSATGICTADIYMTKDCTGPVYGHATIDLSNLVITKLEGTSNDYKFMGEGTTKMTIESA